MAHIDLFENRDLNDGAHPHPGRKISLGNEPGDQQLESSDLLNDFNFNDKVSSVIVTSGTWQLYTDKDFEGVSFTVCAKGGGNQ